MGGPRCQAAELAAELASSPIARARTRIAACPGAREEEEVEEEDEEYERRWPQAGGGGRGDVKRMRRRPDEGEEVRGG